MNIRSAGTGFKKKKKKKEKVVFTENDRDTMQFENDGYGNELQLQCFIVTH